MSNHNLRSSIIKLAAEHPEFRKDLLPLVKYAGGHVSPSSTLSEQVDTFLASVIKLAGGDVDTVENCEVTFGYKGVGEYEGEITDEYGSLALGPMGVFFVPSGGRGSLLIAKDSLDSTSVVQMAAALKKYIG